MNEKGISWLLMLVLSIIWGSSFILMKRGLDAFSSTEVAALRISIAFLALSPLLWSQRKFSVRRHWRGLLVMGVFGNFIPAFLFTAAETRISSSLTGMLNALTPMFTIVVALVWMRARPTTRQTWGVVTGFIAACALVIFEPGSALGGNIAFGGLVLLATICYAVSANGIRKYLNDVPAVTATVWAFTCTGPVALVFLFGCTDFVTHMSAHPQGLASLGFVSILAIFGSAISVILYNVLIRRSGPLFASSCTYLIPVVAVMWGVLDAERVNFMQILAIVVIIFSVWLINQRTAVAGSK